MNDKISIVVPIYGVENYLDECVYSLINQDYKNLEILLVDDGSKDKCPQICDKWAKIDNRIRVIHKENGGVADARNCGLNECKGKYILFVDSDDILEKGAIEEIVKNIESHDMIVWGYSKKYKNHYTNKIIDSPISTENINERIIKDENFGGYLWNKLFSKEIINRYKIRFDEKLSFCEDLLFVYEYCKHINNLNVIYKALYNYRMRNDSVTNSINKVKKVSMLYVYEYIYRDCHNQSLKEEVAYFYINMYYQLSEFVPKDKICKEILEQEKKIIKIQSFSRKIKFFIVKNFPNLFRYIKTKKYSDLYE